MAKKSFDYSKWDNIELSDDESDLHPNIDKESWFRMKHRSRLEREAREDEEIKEMNKQNEQDNARIKIIKARLNGLQSGQADEDAEFEDMEALQGELSELEARVAEKEKRIKTIHEKRAWNIDNICKVKEEKSIINDAKMSSLKADDFKPTGLTESVLQKNQQQREKEAEPVAPTASDSTPAAQTSAPTPTPAPVSKPASTSSPAAVSPPAPGPAPVKDPKLAAMSYNDYVLEHEATLEHYSEIASLDATKEYLFKHGHILLHEHAQSYMLLSCLEDEMNGKHRRMRQVCRQSQILSHITELATSMRRDPRDVILPFFMRLQEPEHLKGFNDAVYDFTVRIQKRAVEKRKEMDAERRREQGDGEVPLGPGGLNPYEVLEQLPAILREAFDSQDVEQLHKAVAQMSPAEARKWMKMCVDSGLWVPNDANEFEGPIDEEEGEDEPIPSPAEDTS
eukprot:CAMPEP_0185021224 /NCGR_PEP_ID=MMETSP1103-20130426/3905_1 /TAXON_ID=36769 /ORGANISM="Paraphysomonas bandaiensis, Strain Caron Lab Isolate" /LENGTH=451 /DNA_ID=CAMNT_0027552621 /DNA_START=63 /DNA_END=1421 /DNA_ORIENTATION=-